MKEKTSYTNQCSRLHDIFVKLCNICIIPSKKKLQVIVVDFYLFVDNLAGKHTSIFLSAFCQIIRKTSLVEFINFVFFLFSFPNPNPYVSRNIFVSYMTPSATFLCCLSLLEPSIQDGAKQF